MYRPCVMSVHRVSYLMDGAVAGVRRLEGRIIIADDVIPAGNTAKMEGAMK